MLVAKTILNLVALLPVAMAYPKFLVQEKRCGIALIEGETIMDEKAVQSKDKTVTVLRGNTKLATGAPYVPGETLKISLDVPGALHVFETQGGTFEQGKCNKAKRILPNEDGFAEFVAPKDGFDVLIWAGYATKKEAVTITQAFVLTGEKGTRDAPVDSAPPRAAAVPEAATPPKNPPATTATTTTDAASESKGDGKKGNNNNNLRHL